MTRRIDHVDGKPVHAQTFLNPCMEGRVLARLIDVVEYPESSGTFLPVYAYAAECCEVSEPVEIITVGGRDYPDKMSVIFHQTSRCPSGQCIGTTEAVWDGVDSWNGSITLIDGVVLFTLRFTNTATPTFEVTWSCSAGGSDAEVAVIDCLSPFAAHGDMHPSECCRCPDEVSTIVLQFIGGCRRRQLARLIDHKDGLPVYAYANTCLEAAEDDCREFCCDLIECKLRIDVIGAGNCDCWDVTGLDPPTTITIPVTRRIDNVVVPDCFDGLIEFIQVICTPLETLCPDGSAQVRLDVSFEYGAACTGTATYTACDCDSLDVTLPLTLVSSGSTTCCTGTISIRLYRA